MAKIYLTCVAERLGLADGSQLEPLHLLRAAAEGDRHGEHAAVADPRSADLVLFCEGHADDAACGPSLGAVRRDALYRRFRGKCLVISGMDRIVPLVPGIFASAERRWHRPALARAGPYLTAPNPFLRGGLPDRGGEAEAWLASFVGCVRDVPIRRRLMQVDDPRIRVVDTSEAFIGAIRAGQSERVLGLKRDYVATALASRFVLCPRGFGASSIRLFEALELGRAPVIISDAWVAPEGPGWPDISVRVPERDLARLPEILEAREAEAPAMGRAARRAWEEHFAPESLFHWVVEQGLRLLGSGRVPRQAARILAWSQLVQPYHLRRLGRRAKARGLRTLGLRR